MDIEVTSVTAQRVYAISSGPAPIPRDQVPPLVWRLWEQLRDRLVAAGIEPPPTGIAWYERMTSELGEHSQRVWAGYLAADELGGEISPTVLEGATRVAQGVHLGPMSSIRSSWNELFDWVHQHGGRSAGYAREVHLKAWPAPEEEWVTLLQLPFELVEG